MGARRCHTAVAMLNNSYKKAAGRRECIRERKNLIVTSCRYSNSKKKKGKPFYSSFFFTIRLLRCLLLLLFGICIFSPFDLTCEMSALFSFSLLDGNQNRRKRKMGEVCVAQGPSSDQKLLSTYFKPARRLVFFFL